jgi:hypothetical protein
MKGRKKERKEGRKERRKGVRTMGEKKGEEGRGRAWGWYGKGVRMKGRNW